MPKRAYVPIETTQNDPYKLHVPMQDATLAPIGKNPDGSNIYPDRDLTGTSFEGTITPGWDSPDSWSFTVTINTSGHYVDFDVTGLQTDAMPLDCIYDVVDTTGGGRFTFMGGPFIVRRKVTP
jgi:hypothetical protein